MIEVVLGGGENRSGTHRSAVVCLQVTPQLVPAAHRLSALIADLARIACDAQNIGDEACYERERFIGDIVEQFAR